MLEQGQETQESTNIQDHQTQPEEGNEQGEHVLQMIQSDVTKDKVQKHSLTEQEVQETTAPTTTEEVKLWKLLVWN